MITEDFVSYETAKLLKEKGFREHCTTAYYPKATPGVRIECPTLQMAMKWVREVHNLECDISFDPYSKASKEPPYWMSINTSKFDSPHHSAILWQSPVRTHFDTYEEAVEAAIKYCLENVI